MKKLIALLLALLMVASTVVAVSAEGTEGTTPPTAPIIRGVQTSTTPAADGTYSIRFLATVHSLEGTEVGFEVVANYATTKDETTTTGSAVYSKEQGDVNMASKKLYKSVIAAGSTVTLEELAQGDNTAIGICAAVIEGVPADADVVFEVNTYVEYEDEKIRSAVATTKYIDGEIQDFTGGSVSYSQNFNTTSSAAAAVNAGVKNLYSGKMNPTISNGMLRIPNVEWDDAFVTLVGNDYFASNAEDLDTYVIEMDLDITRIGNINFVFNGSVNDTAETNIDNYKQRTGATMVQFRMDSNLKDSMANLTGKRFYATLAYFSNNTQSGPSSWGTPLYTVPTFGNNPKSAVFKLGIVVDNTPTGGCDIHLFVNGNYIKTQQYTETAALGSDVDGEFFDVTANSYVALWAQNSELSIDNLKVGSVSLTKSEGAITGYTETTAATAYSQTFDNDPVVSAGVTRPYANDKCPAGLPITINDAGQLQFEKHSWHTNPDYYAHIISSGNVKAANIYKLEADINITSLSGFGFMINNDVDEANGNDKTYLENMLYVSFRKLSATDPNSPSTTGKNGLHFRIAYYNDAGGQAGYKDILIDEQATTLNAKFTMIVDSTDSAGCRLYLYLDGELIGSEVFDDTYDVKTASSIGIWAQDTIATVDNVKLTGLKKNTPNNAN